MTLPTGGAALMIVCLAALAAAARDQPSHGHPPADLVLDGGVVVTLDDAHPRATALAVRRGRIVAVGGPADVKPASPTPTSTSRASAPRWRGWTSWARPAWRRPWPAWPRP